jgi:hypothetical protein
MNSRTRLRKQVQIEMEFESEGGIKTMSLSKEESRPG